MFRLFILFLLSKCYQMISLHGPGLHPDKIRLPARYFFVNFTAEAEKQTLDPSSLAIKINGNSKIRDYCRIWVNTLDRKDGTFIVRYKVYEVCYNLAIDVLYEGIHIGESPYVFKDPIYPDECNCPEESFKKWILDNKCYKSHVQISEDLAKFPKIDMVEAVKKIVQNFHKPESTSFCHYVIKNNEVFRDCYGKHVGFNMFSDNILLFLMRRVKLPDMEFVMNLGDWPLSKKNSETLPIFSWCGSDDTNDILLPTYDITESTIENMGRVTLDILSVQGSIALPWSKRKSQAFWRGRDSRLERLHLIDIARANPDLFNASLTNFFFFRHKESEYGPKQPHVSFFKFFDYKYQINIDGTVAAYRFPYLLAGGGLVLKQESPYYEHFYSLLEPWVHYVPVARDLSDIVEKVRWASQRDQEAKAIADNAREFANQHLLPEHIVCYHAVLFWEWSKRISSEVKVREGMTHVPQTGSKCDCESKNGEAKDEL